MKPPTSAQSVERSSRASRRRPTRNRHNLLPMKNRMKNQMKNRMKNHPVGAGPKVLLVDQADRLGRLVDLLVNQAGHLGRLAGLPVDQADHLEGGAEDGEPRKGWIEPGKAWIKLG